MICINCNEKMIPIEIDLLESKINTGFEWYHCQKQKDKKIDQINKHIQYAKNTYEEFLSKCNQPERSKREDSQKCEMRCSEHCGNTVRDK